MIQHHLISKICLDFLVEVKYETMGKDLNDPLSDFIKVRGVSEEKTQITP